MKKFFRSLLALFVLAPAAAFANGGMNGALIGNAPDLVSGQTGYNSIVENGRTWNGTESIVQQVVPIAGTLKNLRVCLNGVSGSGSRVFTVRKNGADQALTTTITAATCNADVTHTFTVAAGDLLSIKEVTSGTLNSNQVYWSMVFVAGNDNEYPVLMATNSDVGAGATRYHDLQGDSGGAFTEQFIQSVMPTSGVISKMYVQMNGNATTSTYVTTLRKNNVDQSLTVSIAAGAATGNDTSNTVTVAAGDIITVKIVNNGSVDRKATVGMKFAPTTDGESIATANSASNLNQGNTTFTYAMGGGNAANTTETNVQQMVPAGTLKNLRGATFGNVGGSGQTTTHMVRVNSADSTLTCNIASNAKACNDTTHSVSVNNDDIVDFKYSNSATTGTTQPYAGMVIALPTTAPTATPTPTPTPTPVGGSAQHLGLLGAG